MKEILDPVNMGLPPVPWQERQRQMTCQLSGKLACLSEGIGASLMSKRRHPGDCKESRPSLRSEPPFNILEHGFLPTWSNLRKGEWRDI